jgi:dihydropteroate synthase
MLWQLRDRTLDITRPLVMGIVNVTPDSFSDGGQHSTTETAVSHALELARQGADILDIGGESTRPGATPVPLDEEMRRVLPVITALAKQTTALLSIDTYKAGIARSGLAAGAHLVNDITALRGDPAMSEVVRQAGAGVVLMHMQGTPQTMQIDPRYDDVTAEVAAFFEERLQRSASWGIAAECVALDPGIGFGKTSAHNLTLLARLEEFQRFGRPVCLGLSRKGFLGRRLGRPVERRLAGSLAAVCHALGRRAAQVLRVHDVEETCDAVSVYAAIDEFRPPPAAGGVAAPGESRKTTGAAGEGTPGPAL